MCLQVADLRLKLATVQSKNIVLSNREIRLLRYVDVEQEKDEEDFDHENDDRDDLDDEQAWSCDWHIQLVKWFVKSLYLARKTMFLIVMIFLIDNNISLF